MYLTLNFLRLETVSHTEETVNNSYCPAQYTPIYNLNKFLHLILAKKTATFEKSISSQNFILSLSFTCYFDIFYICNI